MSDDPNDPEPQLTPEDTAALEAELAAYAEAQAADLGLSRAQWKEPVHTTFTAAQRPHTTLMVSGLSLAHDQLVTHGLRGIGYRVVTLDAPDGASLQVGKEFGNRGQCNPTYFTVGNLVKALIQLRDEQGLTPAEIIDRYVFLTAGACGPCRFGTYVTEYRKALRDAGFDGFRVLLFQQQGGVKQATGEELGLKVDLSFALTIVRALMAGDVLNLIGYRLRPYEVEKGATDAALAHAKRLVGAALERRGSVLRALTRCRPLFAAVAVDRTIPKPVVSVIGEFWAMTTEGDGNYHLQRFLEREGAEVDVQGVTNWILYMVWENRHDTRKRMVLRGSDGGRKGLEGKDPTRKLWALTAAEPLLRATFQAYAHAAGLYGYALPDMDDLARRAQPHYDTMIRGGEGHMEVGKLIHFVEDQVNHMTISVKPFGCMPSSGVSDGVQSLVTKKWPQAIFLPLETTGDGAVNAQSRVQMMLFEARRRAREEFERALSERGLDEAAFRARLGASRRWRSGLSRPPHRSASVVTSLVHALR